MATATYKRRRRTGILSEGQRDSAVRRLQNEASVRQRMSRRTGAAAAPTKADRPEQQQRAAEQIRSRANRQRRVTSHGGAPKGTQPGDNGLKGVTVKSGQTLWQIAQSRLGSGTKWRQIARANNIRNPRKLQIGTHLTIPGQTKKADMPRKYGGRGDYGGGLPDRVAKMRHNARSMVEMPQRRMRKKYGRPLGPTGASRVMGRKGRRRFL